MEISPFLIKKKFLYYYNVLFSLSINYFHALNRIYFHKCYLYCNEICIHELTKDFICDRAVFISNKFLYVVAIETNLSFNVHRKDFSNIKLCWRKRDYCNEIVNFGCKFVATLKVLLSLKLLLHAINIFRAKNSLIWRFKI